MSKKSIVSILLVFSFVQPAFAETQEDLENKYVELSASGTPVRFATEMDEIRIATMEEMNERLLLYSFRVSGKPGVFYIANKDSVVSDIDRLEKKGPRFSIEQFVRFSPNQIEGAAFKNVGGPSMICSVTMSANIARVNNEKNLPKAMAITNNFLLGSTVSLDIRSCVWDY